MLSRLALHARQLAVHRAVGLLGGNHPVDGERFSGTVPMVPHLASRRYGWTHYGVMIPDLQAPHRFFSIMSIVGTPGARVFDTDHALRTHPRGNATVVSGTAATHPHHFGSYDIAAECDLRGDGSVIGFGNEVLIQGHYPRYTVRATYAGFKLQITVTNTDAVAWFFRSPVYDHFSLLSEYHGHIDWQGHRTPIAGLCTFEYAAGPSPYQIRRKPLPDALKLPLDFFTYQIINPDARSQLLLTRVDALSTPAQSRVYLRGLQRPSISRPARFEVLEYRAQPEMAPDGRQMRLPRRLRWQACDTDGSPLLDLEGEVDTPATYGLGCGYVAGYAYTGTLEGRRIEGRAYLEYIDRRH
jgi:hypothetical protein